MVEELESSIIICGWKIIANNAPKSVPIVSALIGGVFFTIIIKTITGTIKRINEILNVFEIVSIKKELSVTPSDVCKIPRIIKTIKVIEILGTVVYVRYFICLKRSTLVTAAARFVVSLSGDNLSPK